MSPTVSSRYLNGNDMERIDTQSIGDVLRLAFQDNCMQDRLDERKAVDAWSRVVGPDLAAQCMRPVVRNALMTIGVRNASLRQELTMNRSRLCAAVNSVVGRDIIKEIRFAAPQYYKKY